MKAHSVEHQEGNLIAHKHVVGALSFASVIDAIPSHRAYNAWRAKDGTFRIGVGHAWRMMSAPSDSPLDLSSMKALLEAAAGEHWKASYAFAWSHFDPRDRRNTDDPKWKGFAPLEVSIPEISWVWEDDTLTRTILCDQDRLENVLATAESIEKRARRADSSDVGPEDLMSVRSHDGDGDYETMVAKGLAAIEEGLVEKVVLARTISYQASRDVDVSKTLQTLSVRFPDCFVFAIRPGGSQNGPSPVFLGATPERLVKVEKGRVITEALAGSAPRGVSSQMDERLGNELLCSDKDRHEHNVVCSRVEDALKDHVENLVRGPTQIKRLRNVQHLHTGLEADLRSGSGVVDLVGALHPTPAVGGHPTPRALALIRELESFPRGLYAGTAGWFDQQGSGEFAVLIRSALVIGGDVILYAGAGIVAGSEADKEARETRVKLSAVLESLR